MPAKPTQVQDPYATLGLEPGAPSAEVKRAYRRLAKTFHPDSAGDRAIPRFLAIQAAYEQIRTGRVTLGGTRGARAPTPSPAPTAEPWRADPDRARAARERARRGGAGSGTGTRAGSNASGGSTGAGTPGGQATGGRKSTGTSGTGGAGSRRRATRKATMGSTSYDEARDPADATWSGASWYGPSTGEYWIVNPREYADPRKHGPDYLQRARRPLHDAGTRSPGIEEGAEPTGTADATADPSPEATTTSGQAPRFEPAPVGTSGDPGARAPRWSAAATGSGWAPTGEARSAAADREGLRGAEARPDAHPSPTVSLGWLTQPSDDPVHRLGLALVAWPPIGLAAAALIGDATGCSTFSAQCDGADAMLPWLAQAVILGLLLLLPPLSRVLAVGSVAVLAALIPVTSVVAAVAASGTSQAAATLAVLLGVAWLVGVAWAVASRVRRPGQQTGATT